MVQAMTISLSLPCEARFVSLLRLEVSWLCAQSDWPVDATDDLLLVVSEIAGLCLAAADDPSATLHAEVEATEESVRVALRVPATSEPIESDPLVTTIIEALSDEHDASREDGEFQAWVRKIRPA
jgi:hypothetical protein